jgi:drug/metabolite transporter (DMT)-like permease
MAAARTKPKHHRAFRTSASDQAPRYALASASASPLFPPRLSSYSDPIMSLVSPARWRLSAVPPILQAMVWMILGGATGGIMNVIIRQLARDIDPLEIVFFRNFFGLLVMVPFMARMRLGGLRTSKMGFYLIRGAVAFISMVTWFVGIARVPLATATALNFTAPLFATCLAALILREEVRARRWTAIAIGLAGVVIILRPFGALDANLFLIIASAATAAMGSITVRFLSRTESAVAICTYMMLFLAPMSLVPALFVWQWPGLALWPALILLGILGMAGQLTVVRALSIAEASAIAPFEFMRLPYAAFLGYLFFGERPDGWTWLGAAIIIASSLYVAHREARLARRDPARVSRGRPHPAPPA